MTLFGLKEAEVAALVRGVGDDEPDRDAVADRFARVAWSCFAEPGDRVAGDLLTAIGAPAALEAMIERADPETLASASGLPTDELAEGIDRWKPRLRSSDITLAFRQAARFGARLHTPDEPHWPTGLQGLGPHAPIVLWRRGTDEAFAALDRGFALVGARAATGYGEHLAMEASAGLVDRGYAIVSGAAYGIDGMAHRAALASGGVTAAVLAGGLDRFYPAGHEAMLTRVVEQGVVLAEVPPGTAPTRWRFLARNRIIAALGLATVVLEAGARSGSLNTANHAARMGRPIGATPGPVTSAASAGCHSLIREGVAELVTTPDEMAALAPLAHHAPLPLGGGTSDHDATRVLDALSGRSPRGADDLARRSGMSVVAVQAVLGRLELEGDVRESQRGGWLRGRAAVRPAEAVG